MGWIIAGLFLVVALATVWAVKAIVLLGRGIVLLGVVLLRGMAGLFR